MTSSQRTVSSLFVVPTASSIIANKKNSTAAKINADTESTTAATTVSKDREQLLFHAWRSSRSPYPPARPSPHEAPTPGPHMSTLLSRKYRQWRQPHTSLGSVVQDQAPPQPPREALPP